MHVNTVSLGSINLPGITSQGFMARAKGIPALELYRLAQKKKRKLVLCGHSLGGAVSLIRPSGFQNIGLDIFEVLNNLHILSSSYSTQVAALATLAILRVVAASSPSKENERVSIKCITFSQPPVGNAALKE